MSANVRWIGLAPTAWLGSDADEVKDLKVWLEQHAHGLFIRKKSSGDLTPLFVPPPIPRPETVW